MIRNRVPLAAIALVLALGTACGDRGEPVDIRTLDPDDLARQGKLERGDSQVVALLRSPTGGRIIYDPPVDLSLATAMRMRPDLVRGDTTRRDTSRRASRRDTTGGDAPVDTSGGAARRRRP